MNTTRTNGGASPEYLVCFRIYVQASGGVLVVMGNQRLMLSADEVRALLEGVLDYAQVFAALNRELTTTTLEVLEKNSR
jgi:hypothetical protein